jgi:hypothetical protein
VVVSAVSEAIRLLREAADFRTKVPEEWIIPGLEVSTPRDMRAKLLTAADTLSRLVTDPPAEEVERLVGVYLEANWSTEGSIRAVLRAIGDQP